jgi:hypothetical protein
MLTLKAKRNGEWFILDIYEDQAVPITKSFTDVEQINRPFGSFSRTFRLPATPINREYFGVFYDANALNAINPKRKLEAIIEVDTIPVLRGFIQLKATYTKLNKYHEYEVVVFGELLNLREAGDTQLSALDWSGYEHECSVGNIIDSFALDLFDGDIVYGVVERGQPSASDLVNGFGLYPAEMTMFVRHKAIIDRVFAELGMTYQSTFFDSTEFAKYYTPLLNGQIYTAPQSPLTTPLHIGIASDFTDLVLGANLLANWSDSSPFFDSGNDYNASLNIYTAPFTGTYTFFMYVTVTTSDDNSVTINPYIQDAAGNQVTLSGFTPQQIIMTTGQTTTLQFQVTAILDDGVNYNFGFQVITPFGVPIFTFLTFEGAASLVPTEGTGVILASVSQPLYDYDVSPSQQFPRMTVAQYLNALQRCFNLVYIPDLLNPLNLIIEPFTTYMATGDVVDWSDKLHVGMDKDDVIAPTTDIQRRKIELTYTEEKDFVNETYQSQGRVFGRYLIEDNENDFATGELKLQSGFGAFPTLPIGGYLVHHAVNDQGQPVEGKLKLCYYGGQTNGGMDLVDSTGDTATNFPFFSHYSTPLPDANGIDLNFGSDIPQHFITANPIDNLYNTYWRGWVVELFSEQSRKRTAFFRLSALDIYNAQFNDKIWVVDSYWRILKMEADFNAEDLTKVELIKILDAGSICSLTPTVTTGGFIQFEDANGDAATATEECCVAYGYTWNGTNCIQVGTVPPPQNLAPLPDVIGGVELTYRVSGAAAGFEVLTYRGDMTTNELRTEQGRIRLPFGSTMTFRGELLITEYDKINGITAVERQVWEGNLYMQYDDASPDFTANTQRVSRYGDGSGKVTLAVTATGNQLIFTVGDGAPEFGDVTMVLRIDYVLARN